MRSFYSLDGKHIAFADGFGLTRISLPNKAKTDRKLSAGLDAMLSGDASRTQLLAWRQNWDSMHHLSFPELKPLTKIARFQLSQTLLAPDGGSFLEVRSHYGQEPSTTARRWSAPATADADCDIALADAPTLPRVDLGDGAPGAVWCQPAGAPSGVWAALRGADPTLYVGDFTASPARLRWRAPVTIPRGALVTLHPFDDGRVVLCAFVPRRREAVLARFDVRGEVTLRAVPALGPPAVLSPDEVLHQTDEATVQSTSLVGNVSNEHRVPAAHAGVGRPLGQGADLRFLPWHAEDLLDLRTGAAVSRKLSAADASLRRFFRERVRRANALAAAGGFVVELSSLDLDSRMGFAFAWDASSGDGSLFGHLVAGTLNALTDDPILRNLDGWHWTAGGGISLAAPARPWDADEVDAAFATLEAEGMPLMEVIQPLDDAYRFWHGAQPAPTTCSLTREGARRLLSGMVHAMTTPGAAGLREGARAIDPRLDASVISAAMARLPEERPPRVGYHAMDLLLILSMHALGAGAAGVIGASARLTPSWRNGVGSALENGLRWLASEHPDREALTNVLMRETEGVEGVAFYVRRALGR